MHFVWKRPRGVVDISDVAVGEHCNEIIGNVRRSNGPAKAAGGSQVEV